MTTLELARVVAEAARAAEPDAAAVTVLDVLEKHGCWFCRLLETNGVTVEAPVDGGMTGTTTEISPGLFDDDPNH